MTRVFPASFCHTELGEEEVEKQNAAEGMYEYIKAEDKRRRITEYEENKE
jgi:hypothetical protein